MAIADSPGDLYKALGHPMRRSILSVFWYAGRSISPSEIAESQGQPLSNVAYHTRALVDEFGLLTLTETQPRRGSTEHYYRLTDRAKDSPLITELMAVTEVPRLPLCEPRPEVTRERFKRHVGELDKTERLIIEHKYGWNGRAKLNGQEIAKRLRIARETTRELERSGLFKIQRAVFEAERRRN
jgi:DNA-binding transcriptional ArsR family regulator